MTKIIDNDGALKIENLNFLIGPNLTFEELLQSSLYSKEELIIDNGDYKGYSLKNIFIDGVKFSAMLYFFKNKMDQISLGLVNELNDWSNEAQKLQKVKHDEILLSQFSAIEKQADWGTIISIFDTKSGVAEINIKYNKEKQLPC